MNKKTQIVELNEIINAIEENSSNDWDELCDKCSSLVKEAGITDKKIDEIVKKCKKV